VTIKHETLYRNERGERRGEKKNINFIHTQN